MRKNILKRIYLVVANLFFSAEGDEIIRIIGARKTKGGFVKKVDRAKYNGFELTNHYDLVVALALASIKLKNAYSHKVGQ